MTEAYPLQWPSGKPRSVSRRSQFKTSLSAAVAAIRAEVRRLGGTNLVISTNIPLRQDGLPYANHRKPGDRGVAVYFMHRRRPMCFACDKWDQVEDNVYAIVKTIEALRGIERWGTGDMVEQAFTGFISLPSNSPWSTLGICPGATRDEIEAAYRELAKQAHPDRGGSHELMAKLNAARNELMRKSA